MNFSDSLACNWLQLESSFAKKDLRVEYKPAMCSCSKEGQQQHPGPLGNVSPAWRHRHTGVSPVKGHKDD